MKFSISIENTQKISKRVKLYLVSKRLLDIMGSLVGIILCLIVAIPFFFIYKFDKRNKGPMLYKQRRLGRNGEEFGIYKFRSMVVNAEEVLKADPVLYERYVANSYKLEQNEDPRITAFGRFIRKTSLDELPQFFNVLKGEMSLVGPRPIVEEELEEYGTKKELFFSVKPGITGYWQISGRSDVNYPERVEVELFYHKHQSFVLDIKILVLTVILVLLRKGAY
ncbi:MAG: sugar transferase [Solibacillus sp.]